MDSEIKKLLDSEVEADNEVGWELVRARKVPFSEVVEYVENTKIPTNYVYKYVWDGRKFVRSHNESTVSGYPTWYTSTTGLSTGTGSGSYVLGSTCTKKI